MFLKGDRQLVHLLKLAWLYHTIEIMVVLKR